MRHLNVQPQKHVIICCNTREIGDCCQKVGGEQLYIKLKEFVKKNGLVGRVWVTRARCLGFCNPVGTTIVIYPEQLWLTDVTIEEFEDLKEIIMKGI